MIFVSEFHINQSLDLISDSSWPDSHSENPINNLDLLGNLASINKGSIFFDPVIENSVFYILSVSGIE